MPFPLLLNGSPIEYSITKAVSRLEDGAGTHKNNLPLSAELQNALDSNARREELLYGGGICNGNGMGMRRLLGIGCGAKKPSCSSAVPFC